MKTQKIVYYFHMNKEEQKNEKRKKIRATQKMQIIWDDDDYVNMLLSFQNSSKFFK